MLIEQAIAKGRVSTGALDRQVAVVTGAARGIGRETARVLAHLGATVVIAELTENGDDTRRAIEASGGRARFVQVDVSDPAAMESMGRAVLDAFGRVDILVNNAAAYTFKSILEHRLEEWERVFAVNLRGAFLAIQAFAPAMLQRGRGSVVLFESADGLPYIAPYAASKAGLRSLAASFAAEVGAHSGVHVFCFAPGAVDTPGLREAAETMAPRYGMTEREFLAHAAPGGVPTSAEVCATGLVGLLLHADRYHGAETHYVEGLELLGLSESEAATPAPEAGALPHAGVGDLNQALALNQQLETILEASRAEYDELNLFQRPIMKRMFHQGTGLTVEDWVASAHNMSQVLARRAAGDTAVTPATPLSQYAAQVERFARFQAKLESDARGWIRDPEKLRQALEALRGRAQVASRLAQALARVGD